MGLRSRSRVFEEALIAVLAKCAYSARGGADVAIRSPAESSNPGDVHLKCRDRSGVFTDYAITGIYELQSGESGH